MVRKSKVIATLGLNTDSILEDIIASSVDAVLIDTYYGSEEENVERIKRVKELREKLIHSWERTSFFGLSGDIDCTNHGNHKNNDWISESDHLGIFISKDKGNEISKNHEVKENHKDFISNAFSLALFVFIKWS